MTMITLSPDELAALRPCSDRTALFRTPSGKGMRKRMNARQALAAGATVQDLLWVADKLGRKDICVAFAIACAEAVQPDAPDPRSTAAIEAAKAWLANPCEETREAAAEAVAWAVAAWAVVAARAARAAAARAAWAVVAAWAARAAAARADAYVEGAEAGLSPERIEAIFLEVVDRG